MAASGGSSQPAAEAERELSFPKGTKSESRVSLAWLFHVAILTQSRLWGIKYADCSSLSHMTTLDVGGGWGWGWGGMVNLSSVQISWAERVWVFPKVKLDPFYQKKAK